MKCPTCGAEIEKTKFCSFCGTQITSELLRDKENLNKTSCPKCGSMNVSFERENQGEIRNKRGKQIIHSTIGFCKDCGYTWNQESGQPSKKRKTWLWVLGWIFIFPLPLTLILIKKKEIKPALKYGIIAAAWILYLIFVFFGKSSDNKANPETDKTPQTSLVQETEGTLTENDTTEEATEVTTEETTEETTEITTEETTTVEVTTIEITTEIITEATTSQTNTNSSQNRVYYSTNDKESVRDGNTGVYSYKSRGGSYDIYYVIDFDEGFVYRFCEGNSDSTCDRNKIESGDLNSVLIITYHDGGTEWSYGLCFNWRRAPDHLILQDEDGFKYDFYPTDLDNALALRANKTIIDY